MFALTEIIDYLFSTTGLLFVLFGTIFLLRGVAITSIAINQLKGNEPSIKALLILFLARIKLEDSLKYLTEGTKEYNYIHDEEKRLARLFWATSFIAVGTIFQIIGVWLP